MELIIVHNTEFSYNEFDYATNLSAPITIYFFLCWQSLRNDTVFLCCKRTAFASYDSGTYVLFVLIYLAQTLCLMFFRKVVYTMKLMDAR